MNTISNLNKLIKNITEEEFKTKIIENLSSNVSLASLALNVPVCNISSGHFAYAEGIPVIPELEDNIVQELELQLGKARVLGPEKPVSDRSRDRFLFEILINYSCSNTNL